MFEDTHVFTEFSPPFSITLLRSIRLDQRVVVSISRATRRLKREDVITPLRQLLAHEFSPFSSIQTRRTHPRPSSPPQSPIPDISILREVVQHALHRGLTHAVRAASELAEHALLAVGAQPRGGALDALHPDVAAHAGGGRAGPVRVQILVHLVDELVLRVRQGCEVVVGCVPRPGTLRRKPGVSDWQFEKGRRERGVLGGRPQRTL